MIDLGLTKTEQRAYHRALASSRPMELRVRLLDRDEKPVGSLTAPDPLIVEGEVQINATEPVSRILHLVVVDPKHELQLDRNSPADSALWASTSVAVERRDWVAELDRFVSCPVFWGPLDTFRRKGPRVEIDAQGKQRLLLQPQPVWRPLTIAKGTRKTSAIRKVTRQHGERRFDMPALKAKLGKDLSVGRQQEAWKVARKLANSMDRQLFYDGMGRLRLRRWPEDPVWTFVDGPDGIVLDAPGIGFDAQAARNTVEVLGEKPEGGKKRPRAVAYAPRKHPLSPWTLARNGEPRFMVERIENTEIKRQAAANQLAERTLRQLLRAELEIDFDCLPIPHLEERDVCVIKTRGLRIEFALKQATIPLVPEAPMSIGVLKPVVRRKRPRIA